MTASIVALFAVFAASSALTVAVVNWRARVIARKQARLAEERMSSEVQEMEQLVALVQDRIRAGRLIIGASDGRRELHRAAVARRTAARSFVVRLMPSSEDSAEWASMIYDSLTAVSSAWERRRQRRSLLRAAPRALAGAWIRQARASLRRVLG